MLEHLAARAGVEPDRALVAEVGVVDDVADHARAAGDLAVAAARPALGAGAGVERVEAAAVGADVDERARRPAPTRRRASRRRSRRCCGSRRACRRRRRTSTRGRPCCPCRRGRRRRRAWSRSCREPSPKRPPLVEARHSLAAVALPDRVRAAAVVAEVEPAVGQREPALDRAARPEAPAHVAVARRPSRRRSRSPSRSTARPSATQRRGLAAARELPAPLDPARSCRRARRRGRRRRPGPCACAAAARRRRRRRRRRGRRRRARRACGASGTCPVCLSIPNRTPWSLSR